MLSNQPLYSNGARNGTQNYVNYQAINGLGTQITAYPNQEYLTMIGSASAESLMSSANEAYMRLNNDRRELERELDEYRQRLQDMERKLQLETERREMQAQHYEQMLDHMLKRMSTGPIERKVTRAEERQCTLEVAFPIAFDVTKEWDQVEKEESAYPRIRYWDETNYNYEAAAVDPSAGKFPKKYRFLEDANGELISEDQLNDMRGQLLRSFEEIRLEMPSLLHQNGWLKCNDQLQDTCYRAMRRLFPELNYCSKNWKARKFLSNWYSNYIKTRKAEELVAPVSEGDDEVRVMAVIPAKRSLANNTAKVNKSRKKMKKEKEKEKVESDEHDSDLGGYLAQVVDPLYASQLANQVIYANEPLNRAQLPPPAWTEPESASASASNSSSTTQAGSDSADSLTASFTSKTTSLTTEKTSMASSVSSTATKTKTTTKMTTNFANDVMASIATGSASRTTSNKAASSSYMHAGMTPHIPAKPVPAPIAASKATKATVAKAVAQRPKPTPKYQNAQFKVPQPLAQTVHQDKSADQTYTRTRTEEHLQEDTEQEDEQEAEQQDLQQQIELEKQLDKELERQLEQELGQEGQELEEELEVELEQELERAEWQGLEHEREQQGPGSQQGLGERNSAASITEGETNQVGVAGVGLPPSAQTAIVEGSNATELFARDLGARLGRAVPPAEGKKAWRKLSNEERAFWKEESKRLKGGKNKKKRNEEDQSGRRRQGADRGEEEDEHGNREDEDRNREDESRTERLGESRGTSRGERGG